MSSLWVEIVCPEDSCVTTLSISIELTTLGLIGHQFHQMGGILEESLSVRECKLLLPDYVSCDTTTADDVSFNMHLSGRQDGDICVAIRRVRCCEPRGLSKFWGINYLHLAGGRLVRAVKNDLWRLALEDK
jgi:hypothetical protein